jgi:hypothetical protein
VTAFSDRLICCAGWREQNWRACTLTAADKPPSVDPKHFTLPYGMSSSSEGAVSTYSLQSSLAASAHLSGTRHSVKIFSGAGTLQF